MFNLDNLVRADLKSLKPYKPNVVSPGVIKLDANENPFDLPAEIKKAIEENISPTIFSRYPDPLALNMLGEIADYLGASADCIMPGNGSDELILDLMLCFGMNRTVLVSAPTFSMYQIHGQIAKANCLEVNRKEDFSPDIDELIKKANDHKASLVVLCSPNNPTGTYTPLDELEKLLKSVTSLVLIDEAYIEFGGESCLKFLDKYPNLIILRTFSKAFGLAGLRVGYLLAQDKIIEELLKIKQPFNINNYSQLAICTALQYRDLIFKQVEKIKANRDNLLKQLSSLKGVTTYPTEANFILFKTDKFANRIFGHLLAKGILIRNVSGPLLENCLRVTVGTEEENNLFLENLEEILKQG